MPDEQAWWEVAALDPERFLGPRASYDLRGRPFDPRGERPRFYTDSLRAFQLEDLAGGRTRLRGERLLVAAAAWLLPIARFLVLEPTHWVMQTRQFANLKRRAERESAGADQPPSSFDAAAGVAR